MITDNKHKFKERFMVFKGFMMNKRHVNNIRDKNNVFFHIACSAGVFALNVDFCRILIVYIPCFEYVGRNAFQLPIARTYILYNFQFIISSSSSLSSFSKGSAGLCGPYFLKSDAHKKPLKAPERCPSHDMFSSISSQTGSIFQTIPP